MKRILIIEDDKALNKGISFNLGAEGYEVKSAHSISEGRMVLNCGKYDLVLLDVNLGDGNGFDFCKEIRDNYASVAIIFLSACDLEFDIVNGFKLGADDYITKPFSLSILKERVAAVLRRYEGLSNRNIYKCRDLTVDLDKIEVFKGYERIDITPTEFKLLKTFIQNSNKVLTRNNLLEDLWDKDSIFVDEHALTVNINRLRNKIEGKDDIKFIKTVYGIGYMWDGENNG